MLYQWPQTNSGYISPWTIFLAGVNWHNSIDISGILPIYTSKRMWPYVISLYCTNPVRSNEATVCPRWMYYVVSGATLLLL